MIETIKRHYISFFGVNIICILSSLICVFTNKFEGYILLAILPLIYGIVFNIVLFPLIYINKSYTVTIFSICCFLRYIVLSILQSMYPIYGFSNFSTTDTRILQTAILLMAYELIICAIFLKLFFLSRKRKQFIDNTERNISFKDGKVIILSFVIISLIMLIIFPQTLNLVNFFIMKPGTGTRVSTADNSTFDMLLRQIFLIGQLSLYILVIDRMRVKYKVKQRAKYIIISLFFTLLNLGIIVGEQRSVQVYFAFSSVYLIGLCFPKHKKQLTRTIIFAATIILMLMTIYKQLYAFSFDSYFAAISQSSMSTFEITQTAEIYLLGPQSVAAAILFGKDSSLFNIGRLAFDFARSFIGISFFVKDVDMLTTSNLFNLFVTGGRMISSYLLPITGQGYLYFGFVFSPVLMIMFLRTALYLEKIFVTSHSIYVTFFASYTFIRVSTCIVSSNMNSVVTAGSLIIISAGIIYLMQWIIGQIIRQKVKIRYES